MGGESLSRVLPYKVYKVEDRVRGPKGGEEGSRGLKEVKGAVVIAVASGAGRGDAGPHTGGDRGYRGRGLGDRGAGCCGIGAIAGAGGRGNGGDGWRALGKAEGEGGSDGAEGFQAGVEGGERCSGGFDGDIAKAFALVLRGLLAVGSTEGGWDRVAGGVEEVEGSVGDSRVARTGEGLADSRADDLALGVGGSKGNGEEWREGLDKSGGCEMGLVGGDGMEGSTEGHLLVQGRGAKCRELGKGDSDGEVPTGEGNWFGAKGDGEGVRGVLGHGGDGEEEG
eukprot:scaffold258_cov110-Amphora_coffeaeformis.AAC.1